MEAKVKSLEGQNLKTVNLPVQFSEPVRPDMVKRAVLAIYSHNRQPYGADPEAGKRATAKLSRRRRDYKTAYGIGISRVPRKTMNHRGTRFFWVGAFAPSTVGGRRAHPPKASKIWDQKINTKERRKAIRSALAASVAKDLVLARGHIVDEYPLIVENSIENISKTKEVLDILAKLGLEKELERVGEKKIRAGIGKMRGRRYKTKKGPLIVVSQDCSFLNAAKNILGVECVVVTKLNAEKLAPGAQIGRLTIYTESAIDKIDKDSLFADGMRLPAEAPKKAAAKPKAKKTAKKEAEK